MDKYYNPTIEEFHQGFEYEIWESFAYTKENWIKETFQFVDKDGIWLGEDPTNILAMYENKGDEIRVKYLSKEDIESLGFKFKTDLYVKDDLTLQVHKDSITIKYYDNFNNDSRTLVEQINIKTKDEFITLLKQLRIG